MAFISLYPNGYYSEKFGKIVPAKVPSGTILFEEYIEGIRNGKWQDEVLKVRTGKWPKEQAQGVTASGVFTSRAIDGLTSHSGIIVMDFDANSNPSISVDEIYADPYILAGHESISGNGGYAFYIKIDPEKHLDSYFGLEAYFANKYGLIADKSCKDVSRYRFVSFDPEAYYNPSAKVFTKYLPKRRMVPNKVAFVHTNSNMDHILQQVRDKAVNVLEDYYDWMRAGMAFANEYGESGRDMFHIISSPSEKYSREKTDKAYNAMLRTAKNGNSISTVYYLCKKAGLEIKTPKNQEIEEIVKSRIMGGVKNVRESVMKTAELEGLDTDEVEEIVSAMEKMPAGSVKPANQDEALRATIGFLSNYEIKYNVISGKIEIDGDNLTDKIFSKILSRAWREVSTRVNEGMLRHLILSSAVEYNPIKDWFTERAEKKKPEGELKKLFSCIKYEAEIDGVYVNNYLEIFFKKWLLSVVASVFGTHSEMVLVLIGGQGDFKTKFFRNLLPEELHRYYAESSLDELKDSYILMCEKLIIMDDEFGGKNKQEAKRFKNMLSKSEFSMRKPYGREVEELKRLAVLCGTSNDYDVINDPTGNRRIIPVNIVSINKDKYFKVNKEKLWMELYWMWKEIGDEWMLTKEEIEYLNRATARNEAISIEMEAIDMFFITPENAGYVKAMTATEIVNYIEGRSSLRINTTKMGVALKAKGFVKKAKRVGNVIKRVYEVIEINPL
jgi:predicted P-loop ATPase